MEHKIYLLTHFFSVWFLAMDFFRVVGTQDIALEAQLHGDPFKKSQLTFNYLWGWRVTVGSPVPCVLVVGGATDAGGITRPRWALSAKEVKCVHKGCANAQDILPFLNVQKTSN